MYHVVSGYVQAFLCTYHSFWIHIDTFVSHLLIQMICIMSVSSVVLYHKKWIQHDTEMCITIHKRSVSSCILPHPLRISIQSHPKIEAADML